MNPSPTIMFDVEVLLHHTTVCAVEAALTATHGPLFARAFLDDHRIAIDRLVRQLVRCCSVDK
jgi:hypothetical protein